MAKHSSSAAPIENRTTKPPLVPPDERFWQHYSPHAEFPLSSAGSLAVHLLIVGVLILLAWLGSILYSNGNRSLPVEAVRLDLGGGGGNVHGEGDASNNGTPSEASQPNDNATENVPPDTDPHPKKIDVKPGPQVQSQFDVDSTRFLQETDTQAAQTFQNLSHVTSRLRLTDAKPSGRGQGGSGSGGGSGDGKGTGVGNAQGEGHGTLTQREKRMLRWTMLFSPRSSADYVAQLRGLGAFLAFPIPGSRDYKVVRDLSARPARLLDEDIAQLHRIYWFDNKPDSVAQVAEVLGLRLQPLPDHFIAFMPEEVEQKLFQREKAYLNKKYPGRTEDDIAETKFRLHERGRTIEPEVSELKIKGRAR